MDEATAAEYPGSSTVWRPMIALSFLKSWSDSVSVLAIGGGVAGRTSKSYASELEEEVDDQARHTFPIALCRSR